MASNLLIFLRINWPQCVKSTTKFRRPSHNLGGHSHDFGACPPSVGPPLPRGSPEYTGCFSYTIHSSLKQNRQTGEGAPPLARNFSADIRSFQAPARDSGVPLVTCRQFLCTGKCAENYNKRHNELIFLNCDQHFDNFKP